MLELDTGEKSAKTTASRAHAPKSPEPLEPPRRGATPFVPTDKHRDLVVAMLRTGATRIQCADYFGISEQTFNGHFGETARTALRDCVVEIGNQLRSMALGFRKIKVPSADGDASGGQVISEAVDPKTQTKAAEFYLERLGKWLNKETIEVTGPDGSPIVSATLGAMTDEQVQALLAAFATNARKPLEVSPKSE